MKMLLFAGLLLVALGIASLIVPIPHSETQGIKIGDTNIGVQTSHSERVSPILSAVVIAGGIARPLQACVAGGRKAEAPLHLMLNALEQLFSGFPSRSNIHLSMSDSGQL